jgi:N-acetylmuramoyl-L-alanine amidase
VRWPVYATLVTSVLCLLVALNFREPPATGHAEHHAARRAWRNIVEGATHVFTSRRILFLMVAALLNAYFTGMTDIVFAHGGTVAKVMGDAMLLLFGAPDDQPDHAARAVACALALDAFAEAFRAGHTARGSALGVTRISVHSGPALVGDFGGGRHFDYTAYGETINIAARLEAGKQVRVVLSREGDVFVTLGERVRRARASGASLFISIHADTLSEDRSVAGATVYTASERASDAEAARLAEKENQADLVGGLDGREDQSEVSDILVDLTRRETRAYSNVFARTLVGYWKDLGQLNKNPIRSAGFRVLKAHDVPSVLLELGYLSSERDLATLTTPQWREKAANVVARAVEGFFRSRNVGESAKTTAEGDPFGALTAPKGAPGRDALRP